MGSIIKNAGTTTLIPRLRAGSGREFVPDDVVVRTCTANPVDGSVVDSVDPVDDVVTEEPVAPTASRSTLRARTSAPWLRRYIAVVMAADLGVGAMGLLAAIAVPAVFPFLVDVPLSALLLAPLWVLALGSARGYDRSRIGVGSDELRSVFRALVTAVATFGFVSALLPHDWLGTVVVATPVSAALSMLVRLIARKTLHRRQSRGLDVRSVLLVGEVASVAELAESFEREHNIGMQVVGACVPAGEDADALHASGIPIAGGLDDVAGVVAEFGIDAVAVPAGTRDESFLRRLGWSLEGIDVELLVDPGLIEVAGPRLHIRPFVGMPLLHVEQPTFAGWKRVTKAVTDMVSAAAILIALSPVWLAVAIAIKCEDGGPVFYRQNRVGRNGRMFMMWKFRSMSVDADSRGDVLDSANDGNGVLYKRKNDPRVTRVGAFIRRYSIDELPQLINVLNRSMSLVGPRPCLERELPGFQAHGRRRLLVTPGLTGLWQINGRSDLSLEESIRLDLRYVENWTFTGDLLIMWKTMFAVLGRQGAY